MSLPRLIAEMALPSIFTEADLTRWRMIFMDFSWGIVNI
jgi:hypothetical protein